MWNAQKNRVEDEEPLRPVKGRFNYSASARCMHDHAQSRMMKYDNDYMAPPYWLVL